jgi:hypothetical protein
LLEADPPAHTPIRGVVTHTLSPPVIRRFKEGFVDKAKALVSNLIEMREFDPL